MPKAETGGGVPLPNWAKAVAGHLPRTAAAMLELDASTGPRARSIRRCGRRCDGWSPRRANRCECSRATALADLKRAAGDGAVKVLTGRAADRPADDRDPLEFARLLTVAAPTVTDEQFAALRKRFGDKQVAAMVLLAAYGTFRDRIILGLGVPLEANGPMTPVVVTFAPGAIQIAPLLPE